MTAPHFEQTSSFQWRSPPPNAAYAELKRAAAEQANSDKQAYYRIKDPVFDIIMAAANL